MGIDQVESTRAVFLDRDGIINKSIVRDGKPYPPTSMAEFELVDGIGETLRTLKARGLVLIIVTNQPDLARKTVSQTHVDAIHSRIRADLPIDGVYVCAHDDADSCDCRKPRPGLLIRAAADFGIDLRASFMVGDRWRDIDAGAAAGCRTIFVDYGYAEKLRTKPDVTVHHPREIVQWIH